MPEAGAIGPRPERQDQPVDDFDQAIAPLAEGELLLPALSGLAASAALLAVNDGSSPEQLLDKMRGHVHFKVQISAFVSSEPDAGERTVLDTVARGLNPLLALLESLCDEIAEQQ